MANRSSHAGSHISSCPTRVSSVTDVLTTSRYTTLTENSTASATSSMRTRRTGAARTVARQSSHAHAGRMR